MMCPSSCRENDNISQTGHARKIYLVRPPFSLVLADIAKRLLRGVILGAWTKSATAMPSLRNCSAADIIGALKSWPANQRDSDADKRRRRRGQCVGAVMPSISQRECSTDFRCRLGNKQNMKGKEPL